MVLQMREVIGRQFFQCHHRIASDPARSFSFLFRHSCQDVGQEPVVRGPECGQVAPAGVLIAFHANAAGLIVTRPSQLVLKLRANEALVVVRRRIDQVAQYLFAGPTAFNGRNGRARLANSSKIAFAAYD